MSPEWLLPPSDFLGNMGATEREELLAQGQVREYARGDRVFQIGAPGRNVYVLESGRAKIYKLSDSGKEIIMWFCLPGEIFGLAEVSRGASREVAAQACTDLRVHVIARDDFTGFLKGHPVIGLQVIDLLSCRMRVLSDMLLNLATDDVNSRIVKLLIRLAARYGKRSDGAINLDLTLTHQDMADMVGTTRQTVSTVLNDLRRQGMLVTRNHRMEIRCESLIRSLGTVCAADQADKV